MITRSGDHHGYAPGRDSRSTHSLRPLNRVEGAGAILLALLGMAAPQSAVASLGADEAAGLAAQGIFLGSDEGDRVGVSVSVLADFNGDGLPDIAMGLPGRSNNTGAVVIFYGDNDGFNTDLELADADLIFQGAGIGDRAGFSMAPGDFNRDGLTDLAVGAPFAEDGGVVYVIFGKGTWPGDPLAQRLEAQTRFFATSDISDGRLGLAVAATDLDADGSSDLAIGAPYADAAGGPHQGGRVYVQFGDSVADAGWGSGAAAGDMDMEFLEVSPKASSNLGYAIASTGSFFTQSSGVGGDLAIAAPGVSSSLALESKVYVLRARPRSNWDGFGESFPVDLYADLVILGPNERDYFGAGLAFVGEVTNDSNEDLIIGAPGRSINGANQVGSVYLIPGFTGPSTVGQTYAIESLATLLIEGTEVGAQLGYSAGGGGDVSGDGVGDFVLSSPSFVNTAGTPPSRPGRLHLLLGDSSLEGSGALVTTTLAELDAVDGNWVGPNTLSEFGRSVSTMVDLDDDGRLEFLVGAPDTVSGDVTSGAAYIIDAGAVRDADKDGFSISEGDCDDFDPNRSPGAQDIAYDGLDQDCDGEDLVDVDGDGFDAIIAGGDDCNDNAVTVYPGAVEIPYDGIDQDCNGADLKDVDGDGYNGGSTGFDCDDDDPEVNPGATEIPYDGIDQDCDGTDLNDQDEDGYVAVEAGGQDCDDSSALVYPGAPEIPYDGIDQDCESGDLVDVDGDGFPSVEAGGTDCIDDDPDAYPDAPEICNLQDDDCDGAIDEDFDGDGDGVPGDPACGELATDCDDTNPDIAPGFDDICDGIDNDCDELVDEDIDMDGDGYASAILCPGLGLDCDDNNDAINPDAEDICDGIDNNCSGVADDPFDEDGDGVASAESCEFGADCDDNDPEVSPLLPESPGDGKDNDCDPDTTDDDLDGDGYAAVEFGGDDCDDDNDAVNPGATDIPYDGIDQDCSGADLTDVDSDGVDGGPEGTDCDDEDNLAYPGAPEIPYDGIDQDCDGFDLVDVDGDGEAGTDGGGEDCDDDNAAVNPDATEVCNGIDDNCDGVVDEGCPEGDQDGDGFTSELDCDDTDPTIYNGATEYCDDTIDRDCNGIIGTEDAGCFEVGGGWGCSVAPNQGGEGESSPAGTFVLGALLLAFGPLRRRGAGLLKAAGALALVTAGLGSGSALAQDAVGAPGELDNLVRPLDPMGTVVSIAPEGIGHGQWTYGFFVDYLSRPLQLVSQDGSETQALVGAYGVADVSGAYGLTDWLQVGVGVPLTISQITGAGYDFFGDEVGNAAAGPLRIQGKVGMSKAVGGFTVGLVPTLRVPLGLGSRASLDTLVAVKEELGRVALVLNAGYRAYLGDPTRGSLGGREGPTSAVLYQGGMRLDVVPNALELTFDVFGQSGRGGSDILRSSPLEAAVGAKISPSGGLFLTLGGGTALSGDVGAAKVRAFAGIGYASISGRTDADSDGDGVPDAWDKCPKEREDLDDWQDGDGCPDDDNDGDGLVDGVDECPDEPEDADGWEDKDGCPDGDNDGDGVTDEIDLCPDEAEDLDDWQDGDGCPDLDNDGDGISDALDGCPDEPEDLDGRQDEDGCPDVDGDGDGVADEVDQCLDAAEDTDGFDDEDGCPDPDNDGDRILDIDDLCPMSPEDRNGVNDDDGCPEGDTPVVYIPSRKEIRILEEVGFNKDGSLNASGRAAVKEVARVLLEDVPDDGSAAHIVIEVHTDNEGDRQANLEATQLRAETLKDAIAKEGVSADRLYPIGYGENRPMGTNRTERGRERNRRVIFILLESPPGPERYPEP